MEQEKDIIRNMLDKKDDLLSEGRVIQDWFDPSNAKHMAAFRRLKKEGSWPQGFIPENVYFQSGWMKLLEKKINEQLPDEEENRPAMDAARGPGEEEQNAGDPDMEDDVLGDENPEEEEAGVDLEKVYLGRSDDNHFYVIANKSEAGEVEDLLVTDQEGNELYSAKNNNLDPMDVGGFIRAAIQPGGGVDIQQLERSVVMEYLIPAEEEELEDEEMEDDEMLPDEMEEPEEPEEETPVDKDEEEEEQPRESRKVDEMKIKDARGNTFSVQLVDEDTKDVVVQINQRDFRFTPQMASLYETEEDRLTDEGLKELALETLSHLDETDYAEVVGSGVDEKKVNEGFEELPEWAQAGIHDVVQSVEGGEFEQATMSWALDVVASKAPSPEEWKQVRDAVVLELEKEGIADDLEEASIGSGVDEKKVNEGEYGPGIRDGSGPYKGSARAQQGEEGMRKSSGESCPKGDIPKLSYSAYEELEQVLFAKEKKEHPDMGDDAVWQIVHDHMEEMGIEEPDEPMETPEKDGAVKEVFIVDPDDYKDDDEDEDEEVEEASIGGTPEEEEEFQETSKQGMKRVFYDRLLQRAEGGDDELMKVVNFFAQVWNGGFEQWLENAPGEQVEVADYLEQVGGHAASKVQDMISEASKHHDIISSEGAGEEDPEVNQAFDALDDLDSQFYDGLDVELIEDIANSLGLVEGDNYDEGRMKEGKIPNETDSELTKKKKLYEEISEEFQDVINNMEDQVRQKAEGGSIDREDIEEVARNYQGDLFDLVVADLVAFCHNEGIQIAGSDDYDERCQKEGKLPLDSDSEEVQMRKLAEREYSGMNTGMKKPFVVKYVMDTGEEKETRVMAYDPEDAVSYMKRHKGVKSAEATPVREANKAKSRKKSRVNEGTTWEDLGWEDTAQDHGAPDLEGWEVKSPQGDFFKILDWDEKTVKVQDLEGAVHRLFVGDDFVYARKKWTLIDPEGNEVPVDRRKHKTGTNEGEMEEGTDEVEESIDPAVKIAHDLLGLTESVVKEEELKVGDEVQILESRNYRPVVESAIIKAIDEKKGVEITGETIPSRQDWYSFNLYQIDKI